MSCFSSTALMYFLAMELYIKNTMHYNNNIRIYHFRCVIFAIACNSSGLVSELASSTSTG